MAVELDVTFYGEDTVADEPIATIAITLMTDDPRIKARFAAMAREMEENAHALLSLLTEEPNQFDTDAPGGSNG